MIIDTNFHPLQQFIKNFSPSNHFSFASSTDVLNNHIGQRLGEYAAYSSSTINKLTTPPISYLLIFFVSLTSSSHLSSCLHQHNVEEQEHFIERKYFSFDKRQLLSICVRFIISANHHDKVLPDGHNEIELFSS